MAQENSEKDAQKIRDKKIARFLIFSFVFLSAVLAWVIYNSPKKSVDSADLDLQEIPDGLEELSDSVDIDSDTKPKITQKESFAIESKSLNIKRDELKEYLNSDISPFYAGSLYLEEYLSDGDIDGINANDVERLQRFLRRQGYRVRVDGIFRRETKRALRAFQRAHGLRADGMLGKKTRYIINKMLQKGR